MLRPFLAAFAVCGNSNWIRAMCRQRRIKESRKESRSPQKSVTATALTPGTPFMAEVQQSLAYYISSRLLSPQFQHLQFELSGADVKVQPPFPKKQKKACSGGMHCIILVCTGLLTKG